MYVWGFKNFKSNELLMDNGFRQQCFLCNNGLSLNVYIYVCNFLEGILMHVPINSFQLRWKPTRTKIIILQRHSVHGFLLYTWEVVLVVGKIGMIHFLIFHSSNRDIQEMTFYSGDSLILSSFSLPHIYNTGHSTELVGQKR